MPMTNLRRRVALLLLPCVLTSAFVPPQNHKSPSFHLHMAQESESDRKDSDRARVEKNLEDMMNNDWRVFRARLVAKERADRERAMLEMHHPELRRQGQMGDRFSDAISSIFTRKKIHHQHPRQRQHHHQPPQYHNVFDGDTIGGLVPGDLAFEMDDPFVSAEELPMFYPKGPFVDKHRWAHPIPHVEPGCVLIANERLGGVFHQTVLLVVDHDERTGSTAMVINRPVHGKLLQVASETESSLDLSLKMAFKSANVTYGGPVRMDLYTCLHGYGEVEGAHKLAPGVFVGGEDELMDAVRMNRLSPDQALFCKGHASWVPGQLQKEVYKGVWYTAAVSADLILRYAGAPVGDEDIQDDLWTDIMSCLGGDYAHIAEMHAGRGDMRLKP